MKSTKIPILQLALVLLLPLGLMAQTNSDTTSAEENYDNYESAESGKIYCTQKVKRLSPTRLISLGYEAQMPFTYQIAPNGQDAFGEKGKINLMHGIRLSANAPIISRNNLIVNLGMNYYESRFTINSLNSDYQDFYRSLEFNGLRTVGLSGTIFKPLDKKHFLVLALSQDLNGNFGWSNAFDQVGYSTLSAALLYGWKFNDNTMLGLGLSQSWRIGVKTYFPVILFNKTFSDKQGLEIMFPAKGNYRYNFSSKSLLLIGYELEGNSYTIVNSNLSENRLELARSELKPRISFEKSITDFIWFSVQGGLRYNTGFNVFAKKTTNRDNYLFENKLSNPLYFNISLNLVSP